MASANPDIKKYDEILETVKNNKAYYMFEGVTMKDMNHHIKKNEGQVNKNQHKIKKLDGVYKHSVMRDLKQETYTLWGYFNAKYADSTAAYPNQSAEDSQVLGDSHQLAESHEEQERLEAEGALDSRREEKTRKRGPRKGRERKARQAGQRA